jgi:alpha-mannosidase
MEINMNISELKAQAKRLRTYLATKNIELNHSALLEALAAQHGYRDWNTLSATFGEENWSSVGDRVRGTYLGHPFTGIIRSMHISKNEGIRRYQFQFDNSIDVVKSDKFSNFRKHVSADLNTDLVSVNMKWEPDGILVLN